MKVIGDFKFYKVGQGCFYAGAIKRGSSEFVIVYDCGSMSDRQYLMSAINDFSADYDKIDMLIVSHLDQDHFNGIPDLLKQVQVKLVVLPYLIKIKRLALYGGYNGGDQNYIEFLDNPTNYFGSYDVEEVIYIDQGKDPFDTIIPNDSPGPKEGQDLDVDSEEGLEISLPHSVESIKLEAENEDPNSTKTDTTYLSETARLSIGNEFWEFIFYHRVGEKETNVTNFQVEIDNYLATNGLSKLSQLFDDNIRSDIQEIYRQNFGRNLNYTSLCMYHGPMSRKTALLAPVDEVLGYRVWYYHCKNRFGTLLTGDQYIRTVRDHSNFTNFFSHKMPGTSIFQVPHHGSKANWRLLPNILNQFPYYIINHGFGSKSHPHKEVYQNLIDNTDKTIVSNTEFSEMRYIIYQK